MVLSIVRCAPKENEHRDEEQIAERLKELNPDLDIQKRGGRFFVVTEESDGAKIWTSVAEFFVAAAARRQHRNNLSSSF